jgi:predicted secreted protein
LADSPGRRPSTAAGKIFEILNYREHVQLASTTKIWDRMADIFGRKSNFIRNLKKNALKLIFFCFKWQKTIEIYKKWAGGAARRVQAFFWTPSGRVY